MKKFKKIFTVIAFACILTLPICACSGNTDSPPQDHTYSIQYTDNTGVHTIEVETGGLYAIENIPQKNGYDFLGLFDAETGGTQYVNAGGSSVSAFTDNKNIVLYPQFKAKEYTLVLDYGGAAVTGSRSLTVSYNSLINDLPMNLTMENKNFVGWYTEPDKGGIQVADRYGTIPSKNIVDESIFDLSDPKGYIYLYAGFKGEEYTVTFYFTDGGAPEEVQVEYGTNISEVQLETRVDGKAVIVWSKKRNDTNREEVYSGKVTGEMILYAVEFAPVIEFDSNGGNAVNSIVARAGDAIVVPTPIRENYKFVGWHDVSGNTFVGTVMPENSVKLNAKWQAMIIFDTNGGTDVANISEPQGTKITLPETEKAGYIFAGWYDGSGEEYTATAMPSVSVKLYAKYRKILKDTRVIINASSVKEVSETYKVPSVDTNCYTVDLSDMYSAGVRNITLTAHYQSSASAASTTAMRYSHMTWYSQKAASNAYEVWSYFDTHSDSDWDSYTRNMSIDLESAALYICLNYACDGGYIGKVRWKDFYVEIEYPDMSTLY